MYDLDLAQKTVMPVSDTSDERVAGMRSRILRTLQRERTFIVMVILAFIVAALTSDRPHVAMWIGFLFAAYSAIANDSIQTIGTFIASNRARPWWQLWFFIGGVFVLTVTVSWLTYGGAITVDLTDIPDPSAESGSNQSILRIEYGEDLVHEIRLEPTDGRQESLESLGADLNVRPTIKRVVIGRTAQDKAQNTREEPSLTITLIS